MLRLTLQEALSNARKYREPGTPIVATARLGRAPRRHPEDLPADMEGVEARDGEGVRREVEAGGRCDGALYVSVANQNRHGATPMGARECARVFEPGYKAHASSHLSDGLGLDSVARAVRGRSNHL